MGRPTGIVCAGIVMEYTTIETFMEILVKPKAKETKKYMDKWKNHERRAYTRD